MIETVNESEALIEVALRFRIFRCDFAGVGAEVVAKRLGFGTEGGRGEAGRQREEKGQAQGLHANEFSNRVGRETSLALIAAQ